LSHQQQKQGAQQERTIRKGKHLQFVAASPAMKQVISLVHRFAPFSTTVTLLGESGTGKEVVARLIHEASNRNEGPFVAVNCGAIAESLIESELFGHKRGAFTDAIRDKPGLFEEASGGTLFLDEIAELSLPVQAKLLRVLQEQRVRPVGGEGEVVVNARVIAATLKDLEREVAEGRFREDLFYRIHVVTIHLPPLRQRPEDIVELAQFFLKKHRKRHRLGNKKISQEAMNRLMQYPWRGNVRELENCIERSLILSEGDVIDVSSLPSALRGLSADVEITTTAIDDDEISIKKVTQEIEITLINRALERTNGNRTQAAKLLEISHRALLYKIKEYGLGD
jgi:two-component system response regulator AtoC